MTPYYQDPFCTIYHGDCREILPSLPMVDLVLTDPPYGLGDRWTGGTWGDREMYHDAKKWDVKPDESLIRDIINRSSATIIWGGNYFILPPSRGFFVWEKVPHIPTMSDAEYAWTNIDGVAKVFKSNRTPDGIKTHPTQKPSSLISWCIDMADGRLKTIHKTILDPFMGSGTTLRAAKDMQRHAIGIELEEKYCEVAARRLQQEVLQLEVLP